MPYAPLRSDRKLVVVVVVVVIAGKTWEAHNSCFFNHSVLQEKTDSTKVEFCIEKSTIMNLIGGG
jgi:hypothetical protein